MFVAVCDQDFGTSTSSWRKIVTPFSFPIRAVRFSHSTASNGDFFPSVKYRSKTRPLLSVFSEVIPVSSVLPFNAGFTVAIPFLAFGPLGALARGTLSFYSSAFAKALRCISMLGGNQRNSIRRVRESGPTKKNTAAVRPRYSLRETPMLCRWPVTCTQPNSRCRASNTGAELCRSL